MTLLTKAENDPQLIMTWLLDKQSKITRRQYQLNIKQFLDFIGCAIAEVKIEDLQQYVRMLEMKGNKERSLIVPSELYQELLQLRSEYNVDYVFTAYQRNEQLKRQAVNMMLARLKKRLGIDSNIHPHKFRHEHSMTSLDNGCDIHLLSRSLGHSSVSITESYYLNGREKQSSSTYISL